MHMHTCIDDQPERASSYARGVARVPARGGRAAYVDANQVPLA